MKGPGDQPGLFKLFISGFAQKLTICTFVSLIFYFVKLPERTIFLKKMIKF